jgi:hypothetical protein
VKSEETMASNAHPRNYETGVDESGAYLAVDPATSHSGTLIKKKIKFSSYIRKFRMKQLQSHICMTNGLLIYGEIFGHFLIYLEALPHI